MKKYISYILLLTGLLIFVGCNEVTDKPILTTTPGITETALIGVTPDITKTPEVTTSLTPNITNTPETTKTTTLSPVATATPDSSLYIFNDGKSDYVIIRGSKASRSEVTASLKLQYYLKSITGVSIPVKDDTTPATDKEIIVGKTNREGTGYTVNRNDLGTDGFCIQYYKEKLIIAGGELRGTLYGVYDYLESLGCRFFAKGVETVPSKSFIKLTKAEPTVKKPAFEYRDLFWTCSYDSELSAKLRLNGSLISGVTGRRLPESLGSGIEYAGPHFVHTFEKIISEDNYFATHPEYFSEINGKRTGKYLYSQLCLTNEDVLRITIDTVKQWLRENPKAKIVSVSQNDSFIHDSYCTCSKCSAIDTAEGSHAGTLIRFVNAVADAIKDEFPDVAIDTLAYSYSINPPKITKPRDNVIVRVCTGGCSAHGIDACENNNNIESVIKEWSSICKRIYIWDYTTNYDQFLSPFPNLYSLQANAKFFYENNVKGVFEQGNYQQGENGEFGELRCYLLSKILWDPYTNIEVHMKEFYDAYYGSGGKYVKEYFDTIHSMVKSSGTHFNIRTDARELFSGLISNSDIDHFDDLWEKALNETGSIAAKQRVRRSGLQYRYYKMLSKKGEFSDTGTFKTLQDQFYKDCISMGVLRLGEAYPIPGAY